MSGCATSVVGLEDVPVNAISLVSTTSASASCFSFSSSSLRWDCIERHGTTKRMLLPCASTLLPSVTSWLISVTWLFFFPRPFCGPVSSGWYCKVKRRSFWSRWARRLRQTPRTALVEKMCWYGDMVTSRPRKAITYLLERVERLAQQNARPKCFEMMKVMRCDL